jgi:hypothetical protein
VAEEAGKSSYSFPRSLGLKALGKSVFSEVIVLIFPFVSTIRISVLSQCSIIICLHLPQDADVPSCETAMARINFLPSSLTAP